MIVTTTPARISSHIRKLCARLGIGWKPQFIQVAPRHDSGHLDCFNDVQRHISENGGSIVHGWLLWEWPNVLVEAEFHAVWKSPDGKLLDVSEKPQGETTILFVEDKTRIFTGSSVDNVRMAVGNDPRIMEFIAGKEQFHRMFQKEFGDFVGEVVVEGELALLHDALGVLANDILLSSLQRGGGVAS